MANADLVAEFVCSFQIFDDQVEFESIPPELQVAGKGGPDKWPRWKPAPMRTDPAALAAAYELLPGRLPPLYEQLVLSYRWLEAELANVMRLLENGPADSLLRLVNQIRADPVFVDVLLPKGFIPFGKGEDCSYDPVCFDTRRRGTDGDCPVVRFEHEATFAGWKSAIL